MLDYIVESIPSRSIINKYLANEGHSASALHIITSVTELGIYLAEVTSTLNT